MSQRFSPAMIERIMGVVEAEPTISRRQLSLRVCEWLDWRSPNGKPCEVSARKALLELDRRGDVRLPECERVPAFERDSRRSVEPPETATIRCDLGDLGEVAVVPVSSRYSLASRIWNGLMDGYHELGRGPLCGNQIRYLATSSRHGWLGGLSFSGATWRLRSRDEWIGWSERARRENLRAVVLNSRFLIVPGVVVPNLASHVLGLAVARLRGDWQDRYGYEPVLCETFVDGDRHRGTCYRAANWIHIGQTAGRSDGFSNGKVSSGPKEVYVYPLSRGWRSILRRESEQEIRLREPLPGLADWVEQEFSSVELFDDRLKSRLYTLARDFAAQPGTLVPQASLGSEARTKAAYRFFSNRNVSMQVLLKGHVESTAGRIRKHPVVLAVQDTTTLNYTAFESMDCVGPIATKRDRAVGLVVHDTMAFTPQGTPLGLVDVQWWARDAKEAGKSALRYELPIEEKESLKWLTSYRRAAEIQRLCPETMVISVGDREADIHELFLEAQSTVSGPGLLVRSEKSRNRMVQSVDANGKRRLWEKLASEPVAGTYAVEVSRRPSRPARTASLEVRYAAVTVLPPKRHPDLPKIDLWAVQAKESNASAEVRNPLEWTLLTTVPITDFEKAREVVGWYTARWGIEVYHRTLKSGCRIEDRRLGTADRVAACLAIDCVVAWRIFCLVKQSRETPDAPCDVLLSKPEWQALWAVSRRELPPDEPPPLRQVARMIAGRGGFLGRKGDGEPGTTTMWRGLHQLEAMALTWKVAQRIHRQRDGP